MERRLSLHPLTALDASPDELVAIAGQLDVGWICLFTHVPDAAAGRYPCVAPGDVPRMRDSLARAGVCVGNLEVFPLDLDCRLDRFRDGLESGATLGASMATAHVHDIATEQQGIDRFGAFADLAETYGLLAGLEFNAFSGVRDVATAERMVRGAGRGALVLDLLHLARAGGGPADAARVADLVRYAQLSDGPIDMPPDRRWHEAVAERQLPGDGALPLAAMLRPLDDDTLFEVEVPQSRARKAGVDTITRCRLAVAAARRTLAAIEELPA